jgi:hypothetical protein
VNEPKKLALTVPFLVSHDSYFLLARIPATRVDPLFPPRPTSITPNLGTFFSVVMVCSLTTFLYDCSFSSKIVNLSENFDSKNSPLSERMQLPAYNGYCKYHLKKIQFSRLIELIKNIYGQQIEMKLFAATFYLKIDNQSTFVKNLFNLKRERFILSFKGEIHAHNNKFSQLE